MAEEIVKHKIAQRNGHRTSVKRIISKLNDILKIEVDESAYLENRDTLIRYKSKLAEKLKTLTKLDEEIMEVSHADKLSDEIEVADEISEHIASYSAKTNRRIQELDLKFENIRPKSVSENSVKDSQNSPSDNSDKPNSDVISVHDSDMVIGDRSLTQNVPGSQNITGKATHPQVRLPKLTLQSFAGDYAQWQPFWDTFENSIHNNHQLSDVDKFNYLKSFLNGDARTSIAGLSLTSDNYSNAIAILKRKYGNRQRIISRHTSDLVNIPVISDVNNYRDLRRLYDKLEANIRSLDAMGIQSSAYGTILSSVIMSKLPHELKVVINREVKNDDWDLETVMEIFEREIEARERTDVAMPSKNFESSNYNNRFRGRHSGQGNYNQSHRPIQGTASAFLSNNSYPESTFSCTYCRGPHPSNSCKTVPSLEARRENLIKYRRCFICLKKDHISRNCNSIKLCPVCGRRHHVSICEVAHNQRNTNSSNLNPQASNFNPSGSVNQRQDNFRIAQRNNPSTCMYNNSKPTIGHRSLVLLQTARAQTSNTTAPSNKIWARIIMDNGSQRTYITSKLRDALKLQTISRQFVRIRTFGTMELIEEEVDIVNCVIHNKDNSSTLIQAYVIPLISHQLEYHDVATIQKQFPHLHNLELADFAEPRSDGTVQLLIGSDYYWSIISGTVVRGEMGPTALQSSIGWILSGPCPHNNTEHTYITTLFTNSTLDEQLHKFWDLESMGIVDTSIYDDLVENIVFENGRYQVELPWKQPHSFLQDNYKLSLKRLRNLRQRLLSDPKLYSEYDSIIQEQKIQGIIEPIDISTQNDGTVHYLPHHAVLRNDKSTTKVRIVFDASAKVNQNASLNDCLYVGQSLSQKILDIILRFRTYPIALTGDIEKAFLMITLPEKDRDVLRFLWFDDFSKPDPQIVCYRFTRVVFGVCSSPFLLNATLKYHAEKYIQDNPEFVKTFLRSIYVDDFTSGAQSEDEAFELYKSAKSKLLDGGFNLRKFKTNSSTLQTKIDECESNRNNSEQVDKSIQEDDESYAKLMVGSQSESSENLKILGVEWNPSTDEFVYNLEGISQLANSVLPTKRNVVSISAKFFDPLGFLQPLIVMFKILFRELCRANLEWDDLLEGSFLQQWTYLTRSLSSVQYVTIPRYYFSEINENVINSTLVGFCDASMHAYSAVVYIKVKTSNSCYVRFVASKTRVAPTNKLTIPRLELMSALILSRLMNTIQIALEHETKFDNRVYFTDSKVALFWIKQTSREWRQFIQNRVNQIRTLSVVENWYHTPGKDNPADLPSRGCYLYQFIDNPFWTEGPEWLKGEFQLSSNSSLDPIPHECLEELKATDRHELNLLAINQTSSGISTIIDCTKFSSTEKLIRVTAYVYRFIRVLKAKTKISRKLNVSELWNAEIAWIKDIQSPLPNHRNFESWRNDFGIYLDQDGLLRCKGRLANADLPTTSKFPILLDKNHPLVEIIVRESHVRVKHSKEKATLTDLRSKYWLVKGRQFVRRVINQCITCRKFDGKSYNPVASPPLPDFRVTRSKPFQYCGVDYAGPLKIKTDSTSPTKKAWICLFTCCTTRAVHLELVHDLTTTAFIRAFKRFSSRRGVPHLMVSDNGSTFVSADKYLQTLFDDEELINYFNGQRIKWSFNLEKAPWWGGMFERLVQTMKRCLKKTLGNALLTFEELTTELAQIEAALNSRPISYVSSEDFEEPLTPFHLMQGFRLTDLPDCNQPIDSYFPDQSQEEINKRAIYLNTLLDHFWRRWTNEYLLELRSLHKNRSESTSTIAVGDVVLVENKDSKRGLWKMGVILQLLHSKDDLIRGAVVKTVTPRGNESILNRPLQALYPLEISKSTTSANSNEQSTTEESTEQLSEDTTVAEVRPKRKAATDANKKRQVWLKDLQ